MKVLVTGSSGFIGYHLVNNLIQKGHYITGIDNHDDYYDVSLKEYRKNKLNKKQFTFIQQDINQLEIPEDNFDLAIHLAAQAGVRISKKKEYLYEHTNINGFEAFCNFCLEKKINKIIYASSSSVYSDSCAKKFNEEVTELKPKSLYGASKLSNERFAEEFAEKYKISMIGLRLFSVYGPLGRPDMAYYLFTDKIKNNEIISLNNNGNMYRDMTYIDDAINGIICSIKYILDSKNIGQNEIFNIGNNNPIQTKFLLNFLEKKIGKKAKTNLIVSNNESIITHADISKAKNLLGYQPSFNLNHGINKFLEWHTSYENRKKT